MKPSNKDPEVKPAESKFRTKTGYCHILPDRIVLTRDGIVGHLAQVTMSTERPRVLIIFGALCVFLFYLAYESYSGGEIIQPLIYLLAGIVLIAAIVRSLRYSFAPVIERNSIRKVRLVHGIKGFSTARFEVTYTNPGGTEKIRLIMLPGLRRAGLRETKKAMAIMKVEKLI